MRLLPRFQDFFLNISRRANKRKTNSGDTSLNRIQTKKAPADFNRTTPHSGTIQKGRWVDQLLLRLDDPQGPE
jgi:hypothetical protein